MRKKPVSYEWFSYICILSQFRRKSRVVMHFLRKMVSEIFIFLVVHVDTFKTFCPCYKQESTTNWC
ncbi:hypothetical protein Hanom_Chr04g00285991 [Helianthus anomalus]